MNFITKTTASFLMLATLSMPAFSDDLTADTVLATVQDTKITVAHIVALIDRLPQNYQALDDKILFEGALDQMIQQTLLGKIIDPNTKQIKIIRENENRVLLADIALEEIAANALTEDAIKAAFKEDYSNLPIEPEFKAAHILVDTQETAKKLIKELTDGKDFTDLAKEKSTGPSGPNGGDLGWFGKGQMVPEFENAVKNMKPGEISSPIKTQFGWHVIKLMETRNKPAPTLEDIRPELEKNIRIKAIETKIKELETNAKVEKFEISSDFSFIRNKKLLND